MRVYNDQLVFEQFMRSNIPRQEKSVIRNWFDKVTDGKFSSTLSKLGIGESPEHQITIGSVVLAGVEAGAAGAILGTLHAELKNGLDTGPVPIDATAGVMALAGAAATNSDLLKNIGVSCAAVFGFRSFDSMLRVKKELTGKGIFAGESEDAPEEESIEETASKVFDGESTPSKD